MPQKVREIKPISIRRFEEELNSDAFISGLEAAIKLTCRKGVEVLFDVEYFPQIDTFVYPEKIVIGEKGTVSPSNPLNLLDAIKLYRNETGLILAHPQNPEWMERYEELCASGNIRRALGERDKAEKWISKYGKLEIDYPRTKDWTNKIDRAADYSEEYMGCQSYNALAFHTHTSENVFPSGGDLESLNSLRWENDWLFRHDGTTNKGMNKRMVPNPIEVIACVPDHRKVYLLAIFQERTRNPLPQDTDFRMLSKGFYERLESNLMRGLELNLGLKLVQTPQLAALPLIKRRYTCFDASYLRHRREVRLRLTNLNSNWFEF